MRHSGDPVRHDYLNQLLEPTPTSPDDDAVVITPTRESGVEDFGHQWSHFDPTRHPRVDNDIELQSLRPGSTSSTVNPPTLHSAYHEDRYTKKQSSSILDENADHTNISEKAFECSFYRDRSSTFRTLVSPEKSTGNVKPQRNRTWSVPLAEKRTFSTSSLPAPKSRDLESLGHDLESCPKETEGPVNPKRNLTKQELLYQRLMFGGVIFALNVTCIILSAVGYSGLWVLCAILFFKSKDFLSVWIQVFCRIFYAVKRQFVAPPVKKASWILSLIPAYSESEEQIVKTLFSLRDNGMEQHRQVMCIILDGKPRPIKDHMTKVVASFEWRYVSLKWKIGTLAIDAGFVDDIPTLCIEKSPNAGKKDSLILCHDLFNYPRSNIDPSIVELRKELWSKILPQLTHEPNFKSFDLVFCTDADSTIHQGALAKLANACLADPRSIAACGFVFVEYEPGLEWSVWNLYQQFQYSFGQIVRRGAEHYIGKVTCLPGCITMIVVRPEMAGAIEKYAKPVTQYPVLRHQVQYLGTDRRLTYSMLSQGKHLHTLFVPEAGSETVAPQSLQHYLSQRRRWGSNAYFNNYFYFAGGNMIVITRIAALIEISRLTMVYYRVFNTGLFLYGVASHFDILALAPLIAVSFLPSIWFAFAVCFLNAHLRKNWIKLFCGFCINRCVSPFMSIAVFSLVAKNLGSQVWGMSGVTAGAPAATPAAPVGDVAPPPPLKRQETLAEERQRLVDEGELEIPDTEV